MACVQRARREESVLERPECTEALITYRPTYKHPGRITYLLDLLGFPQLHKGAEKYALALCGLHGFFTSGCVFSCSHNHRTNTRLKVGHSGGELAMFVVIKQFHAFFQSFLNTNTRLCEAV